MSEKNVQFVNYSSYKKNYTMKTLKKGAFLTDIHFGKKSNSPVHNQDCLNYLDWFCAQVQADPSIDYICFMGDWNENRSSINLSTLTYSYLGAKKLDTLGLPVYFCVGNHDLYHRHTREVYSVLPFQEFKNFKIIDTPTIVKEVADGAFFSPFLFHEEYDKLDQYLALPFWAGHFEFKGFRITGYNMLMPTGPDPLKFAGPRHILSGHFHQRQQQHNIVYTGNTFPMDFGDVNDYKRGMTVYDHILQKVEFIDWAACPKYMKLKLSDLLDGTAKVYNEARVICKLDEEITLEESNAIRDTFMKKYKLREFSMEETTPEELKDVLENTETNVMDALNPDNDNTSTSVDELVVKMLNDIDSDKIDNQMLVDIYNSLKVAQQ